MECSILIAGVGGQGTLLASRVLGNYALAEGLDVKVSEVHGMAQRGGSVITHVRMGEKVLSPLVPLGGADVILAFEKLEALRFADYLKPDGVIIANSQEIMPMPVIMGLTAYPDDISDTLDKLGKSTIFIDAGRIAEEAGNSRTANSVLIGALARRLGGDRDKWLSILINEVPPRTAEANEKAFAAGYGM